MKTSITIEEIKSIYALHGADISPSGLIESMEQCNEQADVVYNDIWGVPTKPRTADQWAHFFALQAAQEQGAYCRAMAIYQADAFGY